MSNEAAKIILNVTMMSYGCFADSRRMKNSLEKKDNKKDVALIKHKLRGGRRCKK